MIYLCSLLCSQVTPSVWSTWRASTCRCWCWVEEATPSVTWRAAGRTRPPWLWMPPSPTVRLHLFNQLVISGSLFPPLSYPAAAIWRKCESKSLQLTCSRSWNARRTAAWLFGLAARWVSGFFVLLCTFYLSVVEQVPRISAHSRGCRAQTLFADDGLLLSVRLKAKFCCSVRRLDECTCGEAGVRSAAVSQ